MQNGERQVGMLLARLDRLRGGKENLSESWHEVIDIVSRISDERCSRMEVRHSYVSSSYVSRPLFCKE